jgi:hypothetical protein
MRYGLGFYIPECGILHSHRREEIKYYDVVYLFLPSLKERYSQLAEDKCYPFDLSPLHH